MLPKVQHPINTIEFKSLKNKFKFRPMLVGEEKLLLLAKESQDHNDIFTAIKQVVTNCLVEGENLNIDELPLFELEWAFLRLRIQSIGGTIELSYKDNEDEQEYNLNIGLEDVQIKYPEVEPEKVINLNNGIGIKLKYPPASLYDDKEFLNSQSNAISFDEILYHSVECIFDDEKVYPVKDIPKDEFSSWISENVDSPSYKKLQLFFENIPHMEHTLTYKNSKGTERKIILRTLDDFFML